MPLSSRLTILKITFLSTLCMLISACTGIPNGITPVKKFDVNDYLGKWYEIARLDHSFEQGLSNVTADYTLNKDGSLKVINKGWNDSEQHWESAEGKAKFVDDKSTGYLKVSFFGPFYGTYAVFYLEPDYSVSLVSGYNSDYFWLLSRKPNMGQKQINHYIDIAKKHGFYTSKLIYPKHNLASNN
ncbi:lipocalin family protein [Vibrio viridaestus]|uniref:Outer membrane lipoprotein Blc n=1 Tax=Vibrio viridaestus TaxID=2487322 RepID=A0A3N9TJ74_9VIBR|nr:lipocalin family protein [Vibrio viridaestus]RQW63605.1 lipocalin [Vibrio viridaestus]